MSEIRKLVAILVADVVGHSRLAGADEDRRLVRLLAACLARAPEVFAEAQTWSVAQKKMAVALARQLAIDLWRWRTVRVTAAELGWTLPTS